ncbi:hypothetical protein R0137_03260 [Congregibacter brevis]|uniref:Uncharacterized protein n=1 Tax=Congregibacter brevis TaxID=3081201 RepID=A0ABZ0IFY5_9GAMM|nr:hypothetical protein R0137_03260 [Congregibacter sp. IMCC45268]
MELFQTLAECSVAFAGFAAVHAVLKGGDNLRILHRSFTIVMTGSLAFILSILALLLDEVGFSEITLWKASSAVGFVLSGYCGILFFSSHRQLTKLDYGPQSRVFFAIAALLLLLPCPVFLLNMGGWLWESSAEVYGLALAMILTSGVVALLGGFWFSLAIAIKAVNEGSGRLDSNSPD